MRPNKPLLSICIPTYNSGSFLKETISSITNQSFQDYEIIVVNNASTDDTEDIIFSFSNPKIIYYKNESNIGAVGNHNRCLEYANGKYIKLLSSDDVLLPNLLEKQIQAFTMHPKIGLVTCDMIVTDENLYKKHQYKFYQGLEYGEIVVKECLNRITNLIGGPSNVIFKRELIQNIRFDESYKWLSDLKFFSEILLNNNSYYFNINCPGFLYRRHQHSDSTLTCSNSIRQIEEYNLISEANYFTKINCLKLLSKPIGYKKKISLLKGLLQCLFIKRKTIFFNKKRKLT